MSDNIGEKIEGIILSKVPDILKKREMPELPEDIIATDTMKDVIEKMVISHIREWMLMDAMSFAETGREMAIFKRKHEICFKQRKPKNVEALNRMIDDAIVKGKSLIDK